MEIYGEVNKSITFLSFLPFNLKISSEQPSFDSRLSNSALTASFSLCLADTKTNNRVNFGESGKETKQSVGTESSLQRVSFFYCSYIKEIDEVINVPTCSTSFLSKFGFVGLLPNPQYEKWISSKQGSYYGKECVFCGIRPILLRD